MRSANLANTVIVACLAPSLHAGVSFAVATWTTGEGGNGQTYAIVIADAPWSWRESRAFASACDGQLAAVNSPAELAWCSALAMDAGGFACVGPWIDGFRTAGGTWLRQDGSSVPAFGWQPGRPAQSSLLEAALCLAGDGTPEGTWTDALPGPDAGTAVRSAIVRWGAFVDCDSDGLPDRLEIASNPALDGDGDGTIDACRNALPADIDLDGRVNGFDLSLLLSAWGAVASGTSRADINQDQVVSGADLGLLLAAWTG